MHICCTALQNQYLVWSVFETIYFSLFVGLAQTLAQLVMRTVHFEYMNADSTVCSVNICKPPTFQFIM